jgi:hypothetical protein
MPKPRICDICGAAITWSGGDIVHDQPLAELRVSTAEYAQIMENAHRFTRNRHSRPYGKILHRPRDDQANDRAAKLTQKVGGHRARMEISARFHLAPPPIENSTATAITVSGPIDEVGYRE